ncbi:putative transcription factor MYB/SANT family [Dioscorea sansibarensis]
MDLIEINYNDDVLNGQEECSVVISFDHILSSDLPGVDDLHEDESVAPRIGDMYQVEIQPLSTESERLQLIHTPTEMDKFLGVNFSIVPGSSTPIMLSKSVDNHLEHEHERIRGTDSCGMPLSVTNADYKQSLTASDNDKGMGILPGTQATPWTAAESQSFLLGLYIFGKNLVVIRRFVGTKDMGDVLCFYYGKFYRSDAHRRWSECRKMRSRRCIHGSRIFTGWRQQELLSRLLPGISRNLQDTLWSDHAVKAFNVGNTSFEEFIFQLKAMIGTEVLVEAVGVGKGKHDLTGIVLDPVRTNQTLSVRSDIPIGKACSSLATEEIIKFLTGNFRLSKARSNDLFWEAVWPRLLARGWHSEQPKDLGSFGSRNALVFLIPGIKKFSRRKLVKGNHYFDSIADILNKVALDPKLLELEVEESVSTKEESGCVADSQLKQNNSSSENQRHSYLRPRVSNCEPEDMKFTVVDTSWDHGDAPKKVRELRSLPADARCGLPPSKCSEETYADSDSSSDEQDRVDISLNNRKECNPEISANEKRNEKITSLNGTFRADVSDQLSASSKQAVPLNEHGSNNQLHDLLNEKQPFKDTRNRSSWQHNYLAPVVKRRRLNSCKNTGNKRPCAFTGSYQVTKEEINYKLKSLEAKENTFVGNSFFSFPRADQLKKEESSCALKLPKRSEDTSAGTSSSESKKLCHSFANDGGRNAKCAFSDSKTSLYEEKLSPHNLIDLNVPYLSPELKSDDDDLNKEKLAFQSELEQQLKSSQSSETSDGFCTQPKSTTNGRRQSTRNRPLTTKALEAFACGFLSTKRKVRGTKNLPSRSSSRAQTSNGEPSAPFPVDYGFIRPNASVSNVDISDECRMYANHAKGKEAHDLLGMP